MKVALAVLATCALLAGCASPVLRNPHEQEDPAQVIHLDRLLRDWDRYSHEVNTRMKLAEDRFAELSGRTKTQTEEAEQLQRDMQKLMEERVRIAKLEADILAELDRILQDDKGQRKALRQRINQVLKETEPTQPAPGPVRQ